MNLAVAVLPFESPTEQATFVRPILKKLPERGVQATGAEPSTASCAVTLKLTRRRVTRLATRTVFETAPLITGGVVSKVRLGTASVPARLSVTQERMSSGST